VADLAIGARDGYPAPYLPTSGKWSAVERVTSLAFPYADNPQIVHLGQQFSNCES